MSESRIPIIIARLYALVDELELLFPERKFTPDGHLVGSIGEIVAKYFYDLELLPVNHANSDARTQDGTGRLVQIKLTAGNSINLNDSDDQPDLLLALKIDRATGFDEIYNGPYPSALLLHKKASGRRVKTLSVRELRLEQQKNTRSLVDGGRINALNVQFLKDHA
jgi:hypothetical protein